MPRENQRFPQVAGSAQVDACAGEGIHDDGERIQRLVLSSVGFKRGQELLEQVGRARGTGRTAGTGRARTGRGRTAVRAGRRDFASVMMMVVATAANRLRQILYVRKLAALGGIGEIGSQLIQLRGSRGIAISSRGLRSILQVGGDLLRHLLILGGIRLL